MAARNGTTKAQHLARAVADAVGAGKAVQLETVDFNDPNRPKTCLEVDFPILPVNQVAVIEGGAGKPIYQVSKWWARRRSTVFRSLLLAGATKAPDQPGTAGKAVWETYYANHLKKGAFAHLKVADIFMGGGTTLVEGSRLGMKMFGNDLNPVAWFIVKSELANIPHNEVEALIADVERVVRPQVMPFFACRGPRGERGTWTRLSTGEVMEANFDCLSIKPEDRADYAYDGPVLVYTFWSKHGPCARLQCRHQTPILTSPVVATKELSVKAWAHNCAQCGAAFDVEDAEARMAPDAPLVLGTGEPQFATFDAKRGVECPSCRHVAPVALRKSAQRKKKVALTLLVHPSWLGCSSRADHAACLSFRA